MKLTETQLEEKISELSEAQLKRMFHDLCENLFIPAGEFVGFDDDGFLIGLHAMSSLAHELRGKNWAALSGINN